MRNLELRPVRETLSKGVAQLKVVAIGRWREALSDMKDIRAGCRNGVVDV